MAGQTERLAEKRLVATTGEEAVALVENHHPEMVLLSLELKRPDARLVAPNLIQAHPDLLVVATFREMALPMMNRLNGLGVEDFLPQPLQFLQLFRIASTRFGVPLRRHTRYHAALDVVRLDGVTIGRTIDISCGGLQMECIHPAAPDQSFLADLTLPDGAKVRSRCHVLAVEGESPKQVTARVEFVNLRGEEFRRLTNFIDTLSPEAAEEV